MYKILFLYFMNKNNKKICMYAKQVSQEYEISRDNSIIDKHLIF